MNYCKINWKICVDTQHYLGTKMAIEFKECQYEEFKYKARHKTIHQMGEFVLQKAFSINDVFEHYLHYVNRVKKKL